MEPAGKIAGILLLASAFVFAPDASVAQSYPSRPIKLVVGYPPGGGTDYLARIISQKFAESLGQPVTVENKPGANAIIGVEYVAKSAPDGYTLLLGTDSEMIVNAGLFKRLPYDSTRDFVAITVVSSNPLMFSVHPSVAATSMRELIALAKAKPGGLFYSAGASTFELATELLKKQQAVNIVLVPFKGSAPAITATIAGDVSLNLASITPVIPHLRSGKLRPLAITSPKRSPLFPDVPTMAEAGMGNFEFVPWTGLYAPAGTPLVVVQRLHAEVLAALKREDVLTRYAALGLTPGGAPPAETANLLKSDLAKWTTMMKEMNIRAQ